MWDSILPLLLLFSVVRCDVCPSGYAQAPCAWDCFQVINFYSYVSSEFYPKSFDDADMHCNMKSGGMLASIHSKEENDWAAHKLDCGISTAFRNIGLKCKGKDCKWDDGSPITYTNFRDEPKDDGLLRCYGIKESLWTERDCGKQMQDCWVCRVKARTIQCSDGETEYKGGCVSVHSMLQDQKTAESSCPGGGHLVSIHSTGYVTENDRYMNAALSAGLNGTVYIGGQFSNGKFEWTDGSITIEDTNWANGFPNPIFGSCVQMLLASEFGLIDGADYNPETAPPHPIVDSKCPESNNFYYNGTFYSPNFPLYITEGQMCDYHIGVEEGKRASVRFVSYDCPFGTTLTMFDGKNGLRQIATISSTPPPPDQVFYAKTNWIRIYFAANNIAEGTGWQVEFAGV